jgi:hypothetical protein
MILLPYEPRWEELVAAVNVAAPHHRAVAGLSCEQVMSSKTTTTKPTLVNAAAAAAAAAVFQKAISQHCRAPLAKATYKMMMTTGFAVVATDLRAAPHRSVPNEPCLAVMHYDPPCNRRRRRSRTKIRRRTDGRQGCCQSLARTCCGCVARPVRSFVTGVVACAWRGELIDR